MRYKKSTPALLFKIILLCRRACEKDDESITHTAAVAVKLDGRIQLKLHPSDFLLLLLAVTAPAVAIRHCIIIDLKDSTFYRVPLMLQLLLLSSSPSYSFLFPRLYPDTIFTI